MTEVTITGWGRALPPAVLTNDDLALRMDTSDEWISTRSGIKERRIADVNVTELATVAAEQAIAAAGLEAGELDMVILATCSPDRLIPASAAIVQDNIGAINAAYMDLNAACSGFVYSLTVGSSMVSSGVADKVLIVGAEKLSHWLDYENRGTAVLFGDGAGAVVLEANPEPDPQRPIGMLASELGGNGAFADHLTVEGTGTEGSVRYDGKHAITMDGREVFRQAVMVMGEASARVIEKAGLAVSDIDLLIPHQANARIIDATARRLRIDPAKVMVNIHAYGNTSAASIPIALSEALEQGRVVPGATLVFVAFGGGFTWGAAAFRWGDRVTPIRTSTASVPAESRPALDILDAKHAQSPPVGS